MGFSSPMHWLIVLAVIILLFGAGRISGVMGDLGKGIKSFKKGISEEDGPTATDSGRTAPTQRIADDRPLEQRAPVTQPTTDLDQR